MRSAASLKNTRFPSGSTNRMRAREVRREVLGKDQARCGVASAAPAPSRPGRYTTRIPGAGAADGARRVAVILDHGGVWVPGGPAVFKTDEGATSSWRVRFPSASANDATRGSADPSPVCSPFATRRAEGWRASRDIGSRRPPPATHPPDRWSGSRHVVQVPAPVWNWLAPPIGGGEVLEIGPGLRPTAPVRTSTFVDASSHALDRLAARGGRTVAAGTSLPLPDASFDAVLAFEVVEHVEADTELLAEIGRVTRPDGVLILSTPVHASMWTPLDDACGHVRQDEPETLFGKIREAGFEIGGYQWTPPPSERLTKIGRRR